MGFGKIRNFFVHLALYCVLHYPIWVFFSVLPVPRVCKQSSGTISRSREKIHVEQFKSCQYVVFCFEFFSFLFLRDCRSPLFFVHVHQILSGCHRLLTACNPLKMKPARRHGLESHQPGGQGRIQPHRRPLALLLQHESSFYQYHSFLVSKHASSTSVCP